MNKRIEGLERQRKDSNFNKEILPKIETLRKALEGFNQGVLAATQKLSAEEKILLTDSNLLTLKPFIYVLNSDESQVSELEGRPLVGGVAGPLVVISAKLEAELSSLNESEQSEFLKELGIKESGLDKVVRSAFESLNLITYLTAGPKEVRAWPIGKGTQAPQAAGKIHSDFERGFIAADVIATEDLLSIGSYKKAKESGKIRLEGKTYEVKDGDVIEFRFSV